MRTNWQIRVLDIKNKQQAAAELSKLDCDPTGTAIMQEKAVFKVIRVEKLDTKAANVLKQTFLGKGGEVAVSRHSADLSATYTDVLLMGTLKQYRAALNQLKLQPWGLKGLAEELGRLLGCEGSLAQRHFYWRDRELLLDGESSLVMGILNITPDSFSDGGRYNTLDSARRHLQQMQEDGADIVDIGAESTRPYNGGKKITAEEEQQRLLPMLEKLLTECSVPVSVDTYKAATAAAALAAGVHIINDVWGLQYNQGEMAEVVAQYDVPVIVMHNKPQRDYPEGLLADMHNFFCRSIAIGGEKGIKWDKFILDPGLGFAKDKDDNLAIMKNLEQLQSFGCPILLAASRKRFIGDILGLPAQERVEGTIAASLLGRMKGAQIHRVHDVKAVKRALTMMDAMMGSGKYGKDYNS